jgi:branched-chain amino acid transport system ATP-binding protein
VTPILTTEKLGKHFGGLAAVSDLDLEIRDGEILGLIGPNGAGKTTVFNLISGFLPASEGRITFLGHNITGLPPYRICRLGMSRLFQQGLTFRGMTVLDNVLAGFQKRHQASLASSVFRTRAARREEAALQERALELLDLLGIRSLADWEPANLPHGHQMTLGLAIALATDPKLLLQDEPAPGMNQSASDRMTVVVVEHDMRVIRSLCDRLVCMNFGKKLCEGDPTYVTSHPDVCEAYLGKGMFDVS